MDKIRVALARSDKVLIWTGLFCIAAALWVGVILISFLMVASE